jgi:hypothetical protein
MKEIKMKKFIGVLSLVLVVGSLSFFTSCGSDSGGGDESESVGNKDASSEAPAGGAAATDVVMKASDISETPKFYKTEADGTTLELIAVRAPDGSIRTAFNTCQVCYSSGRGYYETEGETLVCQNCGNSFTMDMVGVESGGCNPVPILETDREETKDKITVPKDFIEESKEIFANWGKEF